MKKSQLRNIIREVIREQKPPGDYDLEFEKDPDDNIDDTKPGTPGAPAVGAAPPPAKHTWRDCSNPNGQIFIGNWPPAGPSSTDLWNHFGNPSMGNVVSFPSCGNSNSTQYYYPWLGTTPPMTCGIMCMEYMGLSSTVSYYGTFGIGHNQMNNYTSSPSCGTCGQGPVSPCDPSNFTNAFPQNFGTGAGFPGFGIGACRACGLLPGQTSSVLTTGQWSIPSPNPNFGNLGGVCNIISTNNCCQNII